MKILFWNLYGKENSGCLSELSGSLSLDVIIVSEYKALDFKKFLGDNPQYRKCEVVGVEGKVAALYKDSCKMRPYYEQKRYTLYNFEKEGLAYNIVGLHLPDNLHSDSNDRSACIIPLLEAIKEMEKQEKNDRTIIIGDFNASPFDSEMICKHLFNAGLFKELIHKKEYDILNDNRYRRFYNPVITMLSEERQSYGSYYYTGGAKSLHWYCYDQILVRKSLCDNIIFSKFIKSVGEKNLSTKYGIPNKRYSDHFPVFLEVI